MKVKMDGMIEASEVIVMKVLASFMPNIHPPMVIRDEQDTTMKELHKK